MIERARIEAHLSHVERVLRDRSAGHLTPSQRLARAAHLDVLDAYWRAGRFPRNHDAPGRVPCFIDEHGGRCAVAELLVRDDREALAQRVAAQMKNHYLRDMADPELAAWALGSGLDLDELAWIQPTYSYEMQHPPKIECASPCTARCVDHAPPVYEWDGSKLVPLASMAMKVYPRVEVQDLAVAPDGTIWAGTFEGLQRWSGQTWELIEREAPTYGHVWAPANDEIWFFWSGVQRFRKGPNGWTKTIVAPKEKLHQGAWGTRDDLWLAGCELLHVQRGVGSTVQLPKLSMAGKHAPPAKLCSVSVSGTGPSDVWFVGMPAVPVHWDGASFQQIDLRAEPPRPMNPAPDVLPAVWAAGKGEVWFGGPTTLARWKDGTLTRFTHSTVGSIWGTGPSDVWAVGGGGVLHWDGARWDRIRTGGAHIVQVIGAGKGRLLFVTEQLRSCVRLEEDRSCTEPRAAACKRVNGTPPPPPPLDPYEPSGVITALPDVRAPLAALGAPASVQDVQVDLGPPPAEEQVDAGVDAGGQEPPRRDQTPALAPPSPRGRGLWLGLVTAAIGLASLVAVVLWLRSRKSA